MYVHTYMYTCAYAYIHTHAHIGMNSYACRPVYIKSSHATPSAFRWKGLASQHRVLSAITIEFNQLEADQLCCKE